MDSESNRAEIPERKGAYFECRCKNLICDVNKKKFYLFIGTNMNFDYFEEFTKLSCESCFSQSLTIGNVGFLGCKWIYQGELEDGGLITGNMNYSLGYEICQDIKRKRWKWLQFKVECINLDENDKLKKVINDSFNFDSDLNNFQCMPSQASQRFNEKNKQVLKKEAERKRDMIYYLKKNLKDQQKIIKKLSKKAKNLIIDGKSDKEAPEVISNP